MTTLDLRPLDQDTIEKIGLEKSDLWLVKIRDELFGPFETESLKQYASENQTQFDEALATRMDLIDYKPFWGHPLFQRRALQPAPEKHEGPYWLLNNGIKTGPFSFKDIDKKIEMGLLVMTDHISVDEGHNWKKICELHGFDRRTHSAEELPAVPVEEVFDKGTLELVEKVENSHETAIDHLANLAHAGTISQEAKVIPFQAEEANILTSSNAEVEAAAKWVVPAAAAVVLTLLSSGYFLFSDHEEAPLVTQNEQTEQTATPTPERPQRRMHVNHSPRGEMPSVDRMPASASYSQRPQPEMPRMPESRYPTHIETHERSYEDPLPERDAERPVAESDGRAPEQEHSLVAGNNGNQQNNVVPEEASLDEAMNGTERPAAAEQQERPVEEASDF